MKTDNDDSEPNENEIEFIELGKIVLTRSNIKSIVYWTTKWFFILTFSMYIVGWLVVLQMSNMGRTSISWSTGLPVVAIVVLLALSSHIDGTPPCSVM